MVRDKSVFVKCPSCHSNLEIGNFDEIMMEIKSRPDNSEELSNKALEFCHNYSEDGDAEAYIWMSGDNFHSSFAFGERVVEYMFIMQQLVSRNLLKSRILDVGSAHTVLPGILGSLGGSVVCLDAQSWNVNLPNVSVVKADVLRLTDQLGVFDVITCVSTLEHIGLGRWRDSEDIDGDKKAMKIFEHLLKPNGIVLVTVPCGKARVVYPLHRVYNRSRLKQVFGNFVELESAFFLLRPKLGALESCEASEIFSRGFIGEYGIGCFVLRVN